MFRRSDQQTCVVRLCIDTALANFVACAVLRWAGFWFIEVRGILIRVTAGYAKRICFAAMLER